MPVEITGRDLRLDDVVAVARRDEPVVLTQQALDAMTEASSLAEHIFERGLPTYGLTTGLGAQKRTSLRRDDDTFSRRQIEESHVGQGADAPRDVVRAAMLIFVNQLAGGSTCIRPALAERLVRALNAGETPRVKSLGSLGASDLAQMADIARAALAEVPLAPGEGLALINSSAYGTGLAALALADTVRLLDSADVAAALALEGFAANLSTLDPAVAQARRDPVLSRTFERFHDLLEGSYLWAEAAARNLQDPLTFRSALPVQAAGRVAVDHALERLAIELNAAQGNPLVSVAEGRILSASVYEVVALSAALDYVRAALMSVYTSASERSVKMLDTPWSGLPTGLLPEGGPDLGLSIHAITAQSLGAEASLLAQPASFAVLSTSGAEGIEDRASLLPLSARRLSEMVALGEGIVAIEFLVAAQAVDVRGAGPLGKVTGEAHRQIRELVPALVSGDPPPTDVTPLLDLLRSGSLR